MDTFTNIIGAPRTLATSMIAVFVLTSAAIAANASAMNNDAENLARHDWRSAVKKIPLPEGRCFHASYPNLVWEKAECMHESPQALPFAKRIPEQPETAGTNANFVASSPGLIELAEGSFPSVYVTGETNTGGGILGSNEYTLQLNTDGNPNTGVLPTTSACQGHYLCQTWQQFIYSTDYAVKGQGAIFMQYWLVYWNATCPTGWHTYGRSCWKNSAITLVPNVPASQLGDEELYGFATAGGEDGIWYFYGTDAWAVSGADSVLEIGTIWTAADFNVFGDADGSEAVFNNNNSLTVRLNLWDQSDSALGCRLTQGTTGETNNMTLGSCQSSPAGWGAYIQFTEATPILIKKPL